MCIVWCYSATFFLEERFSWTRICAAVQSCRRRTNRSCFIVFSRFLVRPVGRLTWAAKSTYPSISMMRFPVVFTNAFIKCFWWKRSTLWILFLIIVFSFSIEFTMDFACSALRFATHCDTVFLSFFYNLTVRPSITSFFFLCLWFLPFLFLRLPPSVILAIPIFSFSLFSFL